jgi:ABC-2 type transport system ATP-binding protein
VLWPLPYNQSDSKDQNQEPDGNVAATIDVASLRKRFGATRALDGMTFTVQPGQVTGFVGPNGAGKSTTMRVILGLDKADDGHALVGGRPYQSLPYPMRVLGSLLDAGALQPGRSARNHLLWLAHSQGVPASRVDDVLEHAGLADVARRKAGGFSLGMRQRLGLAAAMLGDPEALMLDEPFNGLDPEGIAWMRGYLRALARQGRAVLVSSHLMSELQDAADHLVIVGRGKVVADTSVADLLAAAAGDRVMVRTARPAEAAAVLERGGATVTWPEQAATWPGPDGAGAAAPGFGRAADNRAAENRAADSRAAGDRAAGLTVAGLTAEQVVALLTANAVPFTEISAHRVTLEQAYLDLTREQVEFRAEPAGEVPA